MAGRKTYLTTNHLRICDGIFIYKIIKLSIKVQVINYEFNTNFKYF
jgi:hypothetical protein